jgi:1,2-diacylglycerol 3-alpha-glucosyltransferase
MARIPFPDKLNIAIIAPRFPIIGQTSVHGFMWPILRKLAQKGHRITVFTWESSLGEPTIVQDGVTLQFVSDQTKVKNFKEFPRLCYDIFMREHQKNPFHLMHSLTRDGLLIARKRKQLKLATAFDVQATTMADLFSFMGMAEENAISKILYGLHISYTFLKNYLKKDQKLLACADGMFVTSAQQKIILERYYLYPMTKIHTIPYSLDLTDLSERQKSETLRKKLNIPLNCKVALVISDMTEKFEMIHILRAFQKVAVKKTNTRLIVVGAGPYFKPIEFEMLNLALGSKVIFVGSIPSYEIPDYIDLADVYINLSSRSVGFESNTFEAMAQQKVVIGSEVSSLANIIENTKDGFLIRPADTNSLCELMIDIFSQDGNYQQIGEQARQKVLSLFDLKKLVEQTENAYIETLFATHWYKKGDFALLEVGP